VKFLADESLDRQIVDRLRQEGHAVKYVAELEPGISDDIVLKMANEEESLLLTADKDFGELVFRQHRLTTGTVLIRLAGLSPDKKAEVVASAIKEHAPELPKTFAVIMPGSIRIRRQNI
jgi:predicted nuclease of predicted toxin-antitoxin system